MGLKAHMICHTHWDREWYLTREEFRTKLIRLIDGLLEIIDTVPQYVSFMLDGQTIAIEDYLEIKPYNKVKLFSALKSGKIISGPWYILPDELLISGESHIRNYMKGTAVLESIGGKMKTAYLPDSFGHPCQMPQIVEGLGMDTMVFWRGTSNEVTNTEFYWESPYSDSKVLCIHMPHGYGNSGNLSVNMEKTIPRVKSMLESLGAKSSTDVVLLMNGSDHIVVQKNITAVVEEINRQMPEFNIELSTMEKFLTELKPKLKELKTFSGEFRSGERSMLLGGTLSTRMYLKQKNNLVQKKVERYLEPMIAAEKLLGGDYDAKGYLNYIWKKVLENHPHDSICGCSIDEVHREMESRFANVEQLEDILMTDAVERVKLLTQTDKANERVQLLLFEPTNDAVPSYLEVEVGLDRVLVQEVNFATSIIEDYEASIEHPNLPLGVKVTDENGRTIPCVVLGMNKGYDTLYQDATMPEIYKVNKLTLGLLLPEFTYGYHQIYVEKSDVATQCVEKSGDNVIENEYYQVFVEGASIQVLDKKSKRLHRDVAKIVDKGDSGDEYTYSWPEIDTVYTLDSKHVDLECEHQKGVLSKIILNGSLELPECITEDRKKRSEKMVSMPIEIQISLYEGIDRIDFNMVVDNLAKDHRLQVQFPSGIKTDYSESYDIFQVTKRDIEIKIPDEWMEYPQTTHPTHGFMNLEDDEYGMCISANGLMEFEPEQKEDQTVLNLTLLRCVGWLSRTDLLTRKGNGGWTIETPEAQCIGRHVNSFSVGYHNGSWRGGQCFGVMEKQRHPSYLAPMHHDLESNVGKLNPLGFLNQLPKEVRTSALKIAENGEGIILRLFSIGKEAIECSLELPSTILKVEKVNLAEERITDILVQGQQMSLNIQPSEIVTLRLL